MINEEVYQQAINYVLENLLEKYKILKPNINDRIFVESAILSAILLVNQYNIEKHYDFLINSNKHNYKLIVDVPELLKKYYTNQSISDINSNINDSLEYLSFDLKKEVFNAKIVSSAKNMFAFICKEHEQLKNEIIQKNEQISDLSKELLIYKYVKNDNIEHNKPYNQIQKKNKFNNLQIVNVIKYNAIIYFKVIY